MAKYIDAEKLIAEIQKLRSESCISESDEYYEYAKSEIIDIIDSLQQEQPELSDSLNRAAEEYVKTTSVKVWGKIDPQKDFNGYMARANYGVGLSDGFKAGAEWMAKQGVTVNGYITDEVAYNGVAVILDSEENFKPEEEVVVQIRKK